VHSSRKSSRMRGDRFVAALAVMLVPACTMNTANDAPLSALKSESEITVPGKVHLEPALGEDNVFLNIHMAIESRQEEYDAVIRNARKKGTAGGVVKGGLLGLLLTGTPEGAIGGGVVGGAIGYTVSGKAAAQIVEDHRNFLVRKWSLEAVILAARADTENTRFDLLLSQRALKAISAENSTTGFDDKSLTFLFEFQERTETRAIALREFIPLYDDEPATSEQLSAELRKQLAMMKDFRSNLNAIVKSSE